MEGKMKRLLMSFVTVVLLASFAFAQSSKTTDVVVVGGGFGGLAAAVSALEGGAKVILIEKTPALGGASNFVEGSLAVESPLNKKLGKGKTKEEVFRTIMEFHHWNVNAAMTRKMINQSGDTIQWLMDMGVNFKGIVTVYPPEKSNYTWHIYDRAGAAGVKALTAKVRALGGEILTETPGMKLIVKNGAVVGVEATDDEGEKLTINAKAVVLATGGYSVNKELLNKYIPGYDEMGMIIMGPIPDKRTGDGVLRAEAVGAQLVSMNVLEASGPFLPVEPAVEQQIGGPDRIRHVKAALLQPFLWVNGDGNRFIDESLGSDWAITHNAMMQNGGKMFCIMDETQRKMLVEKGSILANSDFVPAGTKLTGLPEGFELGMKNGYVFKANTIADLAKQIGVDPKNLQASINNVNAYAKSGVDPEFQRRKDLLYTFQSKGPYYAIRGIPSYFSTLGGVKINDNAQALDTHGKVIPGLYAVGHDMGGMFDSTYYLIKEGSASYFALNSGRIAGDHITRTVTKTKK